MWKVLGMLVVIILSIIPGAICGAIVGAIYAPAKVWSFFGGPINENEKYDDQI